VRRPALSKHQARRRVGNVIATNNRLSPSPHIPLLRRTSLVALGPKNRDDQRVGLTGMYISVIYRQAHIDARRMIEFRQVTGFDWDEGNARKNLVHDVMRSEAEQVFFNAHFIADDFAHSAEEPRWHLLGVTNSGRRLHITFTLRDNRTKIRIISARDMSRKERRVYEAKHKAKGT
jgi:uncharacterized protein